MTSIEQLLTLAQSPLGKALIALATASSGTAVRYRQTGKIPLSALPWRALRRLAYQLRRRWYTVERPDTNHIVVEQSLDDVHDRLATASFNPGWPLSFRYHGEDLNTRRYYYDPTRTHPHRQLHIRGFETAEGVDLVAHEEPAPEHHPRAHLKELDIHDATAWLDEAWSTGELTPTEFQRH